MMQTPDARSIAFYEKAMRNINPAYKKLAIEMAASLKGKPVDEAGIQESLQSNNKLARMGDIDIMALVFIVMMEAAKSAREDLKVIMDGAKAINNEKQAYRDLPDKVHRITDKPLKNDRSAAAGNAGEPEADETTQMLLQLITDREARLYTAISSIMKKISDSQDAILKNLK